MARQRFSRLLFFAYLYGFGGTCVLASTIDQAWGRMVVLLGALVIPIATWRFIKEQSTARVRRLEDEARREREARFRAIADGTAAGLFLMDLEGHIVQTNGAMASMLQVDENSLPGKRPDDFALRGDVGKDSELFAELVAGKHDQYETEKRFLRSDNEMMWGHMTVSLVRDGNGEPQFVAGMVQDISKHRQEGAGIRDIEQLFRATFDQAAVGIAHTDQEGRFMFVNPKLCEMLGYSRSELFGKRLRILAQPADADRAEAALERLLSGQATEYADEFQLKRHDGQTLWTAVTMAPMRQADGTVKYGIVMVEDVTEQKRAQEALLQSEVRYRAITETASDAIMMLDPEDRILFANGAAGTIFGYAAADLQGKPFSELLAESVRGTGHARAAYLAGKQKEHGSATTELAGRHRTGRELALEVAISAAVSDDRPVSIAVIRDISERKRVDQERAELQRLEQEARAMSEAAAVINGVVEASPLPIITTGLDGNVQSWNRAAEAAFGWSEAEVAGAPVPFVPEGQASESLHFRERALHGESIANLELRRLRRDGELLDLAMSTAPVRDARGTVTGIMFVYADLTARKRAERELETERDFALQIMTRMGQGLAVVNVEGRFEYVNPAYANTLGRSADAMLGARLADFAAPTERATLHTLQNDRAWEHEVQVITPDGQERYLLCTSVPRIVDGVVAGAIQVATDLTEQRQQAEALAMARDQALEASRLKSEFLATVSHEVRTPMNGIIGTMELLCDTPLDGEQQEYVGIVNDSAQALMGIINDILDFSKLEADRLVLDSADFEPVPVVEAAAELLAAKARERNVVVTTWVDPAIPAQLNGDPLRLRQVLLNLIGNAVKFTNHGEVAVAALLLDQHQDDVTLRFDVRDTGIGLSQEAMDRLFQPFVQADGSTTRKYGGTGLGLAICKRLAEAMDGEIGVESSEGEGSLFWFTAHFRATRPAANPIRPELDRRRALILDPNVWSCSVLEKTLTAWGADCITANSGREAEHALETQGRIDLILADISAVDSRLGHIVSSLREQSHEPVPGVIALVSGERRGRDDLLSPMRFDAYVTRPVRQSQLIEAIQSLQAPPAVAEQIVELAATPSPEVVPVQPAPFQATIAEPVVVQETPAPEAAVVPEVEVMRPTPEPRPASTTPVSRALILLVEDNPNNQLMALRQLEKLGHHVQIVSNGVQAVKALATTNRYDLVFMDCMMPEMDGYDATRAIRTAEITTGRHIPIVAMTANAMEGDREACLAAGMDDYIPKPVTRETFREAIERWMPVRGEQKLAG